jgi:hypothetical protein
MSTYTDASLVFYPSGYKSGRADSLKPTDGTGDLTFTRASTATRVNEDGLIESVATGVPRIDFTGGGCGKLLLEPQRTNSILYSEQFDNAYWTKSASTITSNSTTALDGTLSADTLLANGVSSAHSVAAPSMSFALATSYSVSVFVKKGTNDFIQLFTGAAIGGMFANFNINAGTVGTVGTITGSNPTSSITNFGNGWYRCTMNFTAFVAGSTVVKFVIVSSASASREETNTLATSVILWGAQLELGSYPTSYTPTTTTAVTRVADSASKTGISSLIGQTEGTLYVDFVAETPFENRRISLSDGSSSNRLVVTHSDSGKIQFTYLAAGSAQANFTTTESYGNGQVLKIAFGYKQNDFVGYINGVQKFTDNSGNVVAMSEFAFADATLSSPFIGRVQSAILFPTRKSNAELAELTTL